MIALVMRQRLIFQPFQANCVSVCSMDLLIKRVVFETWGKQGETQNWKHAFNARISNNLFLLRTCRLQLVNSLRKEARVAILGFGRPVVQDTEVQRCKRKHSRFDLSKILAKSRKIWAQMLRHLCSQCVMEETDCGNTSSLDFFLQEEAWRSFLFFGAHHFLVCFVWSQKKAKILITPKNLPIHTPMREIETLHWI